MPVFRWGHAFDAFRDLEREMDRLLRGVNWGMESFRLGQPFPVLNIYELPDEFLLMAQLPGVQQSDLDVSVAGGVLTIRGSRSAPLDVPEDRFRRNERPIGAWERSVSLPEQVRDDAIRAEFQQGILKLHLPKAPGSAPRKIAVSEPAESDPSQDLSAESQSGSVLRGEAQS